MLLVIVNNIYNSESDGQEGRSDGHVVLGVDMGPVL